ncbi:hypothetical protein DERP_003734, partial [Dermatophagoides pteronyssinus]
MIMMMDSMDPTQLAQLPSSSSPTTTSTTMIQHNNNNDSDDTISTVPLPPPQPPPSLSSCHYDSQSNDLIIPQQQQSSANNNNNNNKDKMPISSAISTATTNSKSSSAAIDSNIEQSSSTSTSTLNQTNDMANRLAKILTCLQGAISGGGVSGDENLLQQSQLLVAAMAATMAAAATGTGTSNEQPEQLLASMAPTLINLQQHYKFPHPSSLSPLLSNNSVGFTAEHHKRQHKRKRSPSNQSICSTNSSNNGGATAMSNAILNGLPVIGTHSGPRIFNPEAYCELCNKEFCNKYFLKTHKANKHNIYTPETTNNNNPSGSSSTNNNQNNPNQNQNSNGSSNGQPQQQQPLFPLPATSKSNSSAMISTTTTTTTTTTSTSTTNQSMKLSEHLNSGLLNGMHHHQSHQHQLQPFQPPLRLSLNMNMINLDSFCEICQKEFCNKYFLKKHKQRTHVTSSMNTGISTTTNESTTTTSPIGLPGFPHTTANPTQLLLTPERLRQMGVINTEAFCEICCKEFCNKYFLRTHKINKHRISENGQPVIGKYPNHQPLSAFNQSMANEFIAARQQMFGIGGGGSPSATSMANNFPGMFANANINNATATTNDDDDDNNQLEPGQRDPTSYGKNGNNFLDGFASFMANNIHYNNNNNLNNNNNNSSLIDGPTTTNQMIKCKHCQQKFHNNHLLKMHKFYAHNIPFNHTDDQDDQDDDQDRVKIDHEKQDSGIVGKDSDLRKKSIKKDDNDDEMKQEEEDDEEEKAILVESDITECVDDDDDDSNDSNDEQMKNHRKNSESLTLNDHHHQQQQKHHHQNQTNENDLEKLHSMIKELDDSNEQQLMMIDKSVNDNDDCEMMLSDQQQQQQRERQQQQKCKLCKFQCNNQYVFRAHLITEHGLGSGLGGVDETTFLQQFIDYHQTSPSLKSFEQREKFPIDNVVDDEQQQKSEIFCNICMKEFCSKYFLQIHRQNIHGIFVDNDNISDSPSTPHQQLSPSSNHQSTTTTNETSTTTTTTTKSTTSTTNSSFLSPALLNSIYQQAGMKTSSESSSELENLNLALSQVFGRRIKSERSSPRSNSSSSSPSPRPDQKTKTNDNSETNNNNDNENEMMKFSENEDGDGDDDENVTTLAETIKAAMVAGFVPGTFGVNSDHHHHSGQLKNRSNSIITGRNYCNFCNKELCNKYFMKTHMLKMHGINIDEHPIEATSNSTIGGVQCDICQKELCSKYFLKVHKQNTHGIYEDGSAPILLGPTSSAVFHHQANKLMMSQVAANLFNNNGNGNGNNVTNERIVNPLLFMSSLASMNDTNSMASDSNSIGSMNSDTKPEQQQRDQQQSPSQQQQQDDHNNSTTGNKSSSGGSTGYQEICHICDRRFKSIKWLKAHMFNDHGELLAIMNRNDFQSSSMFNSNSSGDYRLSAAAAAASSSSTSTSTTANQSDQLLSTIFGAITGSGGGGMMNEKSNNNNNSSPIESPSIDFNTSVSGDNGGVNEKVTQLKKFTCPQCNRSYRHSHSLHRHMLIHTKIATKSSPSPQQETSSSNIHTNIDDNNQIDNNKPRNKRYRCSKCNKKFRTRELCLYHIRMFHQNNCKTSSTTTTTVVNNLDNNKSMKKRNTIDENVKRSPSSDDDFGNH